MANQGKLGVTATAMTKTMDSLALQATLGMSSMDTLTSKGVTNPLQEFCDQALDNIKVYRPEIERLDQRVDDEEKARVGLGVSTRKALDEQLEANQILVRRCTGMEERMAQLEALVAVLPTWKDDLTSRIDSIAREVHLKHEQMNTRTQQLEDSQNQHAQAARERLDSLGQAMLTAAEARQAHSERMDTLEQHIRNVEAQHLAAVKDLKASRSEHAQSLQAAERKLVEQGAAISTARADIQGLKLCTLELEKEGSASRADIMVLQDKQELMRQTLNVMDKQMTKNETVRDGLAERLAALEKDTRLQALQASAADYVNFKQQVANFMAANTGEYQVLQKRINDMDKRIEKGHPGLWKIAEQVAAHGEELASHKADLTDASGKLTQLQEALEAARQLLADQKELSSTMHSDNQALADKLASDVKLCMGYVDSRVEGLSNKREVDALRQLIEEMRDQLQEGINAMGLKVKFELLHDEVPQVNTLRAYIQQTEQAMARTLDRLAWLEAGLNKESARGQQLSDDWSSTKATLDEIIMDGTFNVPQIKRELASFKAMFEELGRLASRGQIITVTQAEALMDKLLRGPVVDAVVAKKIAESKVLKQELSGYVPRHELEGLRRVIASNSALAHMSTTLAHPSPPLLEPIPDQPAAGSTNQPVERLQSRPLSGNTRPSSASNRPASGNSSRRMSLNQQLSRTSKLADSSTGRSEISNSPQTAHQELVQQSLQGGTSSDQGSLKGAQVAAPTQELEPENCTLLAVYQRLAAIDEAIALNGSLGAALQEKLDTTARQVAAVTSQVDADVPGLKRQLDQLQAALGVKGPGAGSSVNLSVNWEDVPQLFSAVRQVVNKTVLPEVIGRHASDMQRLVKYIDGKAARAAAAGQEGARQLQESVSSLVDRVDHLVQAGPQISKQQSGATPDSNSPADAATEAVPATEAGTASLGAAASEAATATTAQQDVPPVVSQEQNSSDTDHDEHASIISGQLPSGASAAEVPQQDSGTQVETTNTCVQGQPQQNAMQQAKKPAASHLGVVGPTCPIHISTTDTSQAANVSNASELADLVQADCPQLQLLVQGLTARVSALEQTVPLQGIKSCDGTASSSSARPSSSADLWGQISDLQLAVHELTAQLPLLAKGYELQGVQETLALLRTDMEVKLANSTAAPHLHITLACPHPAPHLAPQPQQSFHNVPVQQVDSVTGSSAVTAVEVAARTSTSAVATVDTTSQQPGMEEGIPQGGDTAQAASKDSSQGILQDKSLQPETGVVTAEASSASSVGSAVGSTQQGTATQVSSNAELQAGQMSVQASQKQVQESTEGGQQVTPGAIEAHTITGDNGSSQPSDNNRAIAAEECYALLQQHCAWQKLVSAQLASQVADMKLACAMSEQRGVSLEQRWLATAARWQQGVGLLQEALPRMEQLAVTTEQHVSQVMSATTGLVQASQLDTLLPGCATVQALSKQVQALQDANAFGSHDLPSSPKSTSTLHRLKSVKSKSNLMQTDLQSLALPMPVLLPSFTNQERPIISSHSSTVLPHSQSPQDSGVASSTQQNASAVKDTSRPDTQGAGRGIRFEGNDNGQKPGLSVAVPVSPFAGPIQVMQCNSQVSSTGHTAEGATNPEVVTAAVAALLEQVKLKQPGFHAGGIARWLVGAEHADTELAGIMHDLCHACYQALLAVKDGPLPGAAAADATAGAAIHEAALRRLSAQPYAVQQHVELLQSVKQQMDRLVGSAAVSTTDYLCLYCLMLDTRLKLAEDNLDVTKEQLSTAYRNLEAAFAYLKQLQTAVNNKGSVAALSAVDRCLRSVGREMVALGHPPPAGGHPGILHGTPLGTMEFWVSFLTMGGSAAMSESHIDSPPRSATRTRTRAPSTRPATASTGGRLSQPSSPCQVIPHVVGSGVSLAGFPYPPPTFHKDKRDIVSEQLRVMNVLKTAEEQQQDSSVTRSSGGGGVPSAQVKYVGGSPVQTLSYSSGRGLGSGSVGLPVLVKSRPSTPML